VGKAGLRLNQEMLTLLLRIGDRHFLGDFWKKFTSGLGQVLPKPSVATF